MKCHGFKGGIGSSSRIVKYENKQYTVGVLVNSNFGSSNGKDLIFKGRRLGEEIKNYDILVLPGGMPGSTNLRDNERVIELIREFNSNKKLVCAICAGPIALGKAGITEGRNVTCYPGFEDQLGKCNYKDDLIVVDENIITGRGPAAAIPFAFEILSKISEEKANKVKKAMLFE